MPRPFRFAVQGGPLQDPERLGEHARSVEALGYKELYSFDHVGGDAVDPFTALVVAARATTTLRVGPLVLNNEFHQPALLARNAISVDQMTSGRLVLGLGTGYALAEHDAIGMRLLPRGERVSRFGESLEILRQLVDKGTCSFEGDHHSVSIDYSGHRPCQERVPFLIGGQGRRVVGLAGRYADIFQFTGLTHAADGTLSPGGFGFADVIARARWLEESAGDRDQHIERSALVQLAAVGGDGPSEAEMTARFEMSPADLRESPFVLAGSEEQIVDKLGRIREQVGISHYVVRDAEEFAPVVDALAGT